MLESHASTSFLIDVITRSINETSQARPGMGIGIGMGTGIGGGGIGIGGGSVAPDGIARICSASALRHIVMNGKR